MLIYRMLWFYKISKEVQFYYVSEMYHFIMYLFTISRCFLELS